MKKTIRNVISLVMVFCLMFVFVPSIKDETSAAQTKAELQSQINSIEARQKEVQSKISELESNAEKQEEYQNQLEQQMDLSQEKIAALQSKIDYLDEQIAQSEAAISEKENEIKESTEKFKKRLRSMYMSGNDSTLSIILGSTDFYEMITSVDMVKRITKYDKGLVTEMVEQITALEKEKATLTETKTDLDSSRQEIVKEVESLSATYDKTSKEIEDLQEQQKMAQDEYDQLSASRDNFSKQIADIVAAEQEAARKAAQLADQNKNQTSQGSESNTPPAGVHNPYTSSTQGTGKLDGYVGGNFIWPFTFSGTYISSGYGTRYYFGYAEWHPGIDITGGVYGKPVVASNSGYVKTAKWHNSYGYYVMIDHGGGYFTLYAHCSALNVSVGQWVNQGDTIAFAGSTGNSTGPHLHFEVWQNYQRTNPLNFVSRP